MSGPRRTDCAVIYKITYPNGKIYIGQDVTDTLTYFGSVNAREVAKDFPGGSGEVFTVTKTVLCRLRGASRAEVTAEEIRQIREHRSNDPRVGYNRTPSPRS